MSGLPPHISPDLTITSVVLATIAVLYGYYGHAGPPTGLPRQLLSAAGAAVLLGSAAAIYDSRIHLLFSNSIRELLTLPSAALPASWPAALLFGALGVSLGVTPSVRSLVSLAQGQALPTAWRIVINGWAIVIQSLILTLGVQCVLVKYHLLPGFRPPVPVVVITMVVYAMLRRLYRFSRYTALQRLRGELDAISKQSDDALAWQWVGKWVSILISVTVGGLIFSLPLVVAGIVLWGYFISQVGWDLLLFGVFLLFSYLALRVLQYGADHLSRTALWVSAGALILLAVGLQVYQALAA
jgi:hypothetical protein